MTYARAVVKKDEQGKLKPSERDAAILRRIAEVAGEEMRMYFRYGTGVFLFLMGMVLGICLVGLTAAHTPNETFKSQAVVRNESQTDEPDDSFIKLHDTLGETADGKSFYLGMTLFKVVVEEDGKEIPPTIRQVDTSPDTHAVFLAGKEEGSEQIDLGEWHSNYQAAVDGEVDRIEAFFSEARQDALGRIEQERAKALKPVKALQAGSELPVF